MRMVAKELFCLWIIVAVRYTYAYLPSNLAMSKYLQSFSRGLDSCVATPISRCNQWDKTRQIFIINVSLAGAVLNRSSFGNLQQKKSYDCSWPGRGSSANELLGNSPLKRLKWDLSCFHMYCNFNAPRISKHSSQWFVDLSSQLLLSRVAVPIALVEDHFIHINVPFWTFRITDYQGMSELTVHVRQWCWTMFGTDSLQYTSHFDTVINQHTSKLHPEEMQRR